MQAVSQSAPYVLTDYEIFSAMGALKDSECYEKLSSVFEISDYSTLFDQQASTESILAYNRVFMALAGLLDKWLDEVSGKVIKMPGGAGIVLFPRLSVETICSCTRGVEDKETLVGELSCELMIKNFSSFKKENNGLEIEGLVQRFRAYMRQGLGYALLNRLNRARRQNTKVKSTDSSVIPIVSHYLENERLCDEDLQVSIVVTGFFYYRIASPVQKSIFLIRARILLGYMEIEQTEKTLERSIKKYACARLQISPGNYDTTLSRIGSVMAGLIGEVRMLLKSQSVEEAYPVLMKRHGYSDKGETDLENWCKLLKEDSHEEGC
jgi:hypothetical protein